MTNYNIHELDMFSGVDLSKVMLLAKSTINIWLPVIFANKALYSGGRYT